MIKALNNLFKAFVLFKLKHKYTSKHEENKGKKT